MEIYGIVNMEQLLLRYRKYFNENEIPNLYDYQRKAINILLAKKNCLTIVPTGGGKSLIFHLVGLELGGTTIVVSPLKALMQEQVNDLNKRGISAIAITSDIGFQKQRKFLRELGSHNYQFVFVSPERLQNYFFRAALLHSGCKITQVVIDEAHCISQWGFDFRPEYAEIKNFLEYLSENGQIPVICALTATLSQKAAEDIKREFNIADDIVFGKESLIRPELILNYVKVEDKDAEEQKWKQLVDFIRKNGSKKILIYFYSKKKCEDLCKRFMDENPIQKFKVDYFHAGLDSEEKLNKYNAFRKGEINILFTTTAFGMGMNIPDIDCIIQYHLPKSIEEYYQQVGRGARVLNICPKCDCLLFWSEKNIIENKREIEKDLLTEEKILRGYDHLGLTQEINKISSITYSELDRAKINLPKLKFILEKLNILKTIGEINGGPSTIRFIRETTQWQEIKQKAIGNSFIIASIRMKKSLQELVNFVYDQDLKGNVEYLPAMDKKIFIKTISNCNDKNIIDTIVSDDKEKINYQLDRFIELENLCKSIDPVSYLSGIFKKLP